ncbi:hypothetical protein PGIGA_G00090910, partial [Pangasianodon gigas]|nr:hypothetical protein [Pangasianodon gigas]
ACLIACLPTPAGLLACLLACLPACLLICCLPTCLLAPLTPSSNTDFFPHFLPHFGHGQFPPTSQLSYHMIATIRGRVKANMLPLTHVKPVNHIFSNCCSENTCRKELSTLFSIHERTDTHDWPVSL